MNKFVLLLFLCHYLILTASAQNNTGTIKGVVVNADGKPAAASVQLTAKQITVTTNDQGIFTVSNLQPGMYELVITLIGHAPVTQTVKVMAGKTVQPVISLKLANKQLKDVVVTGKSELRAVKEQAYTVTAVDATHLHNTTKDINQVLNHTTGVKIREEGGLGSNYSFSLNGFTGKQVKFFLDGMPMDNFGSSLSLNNLPVNMAERIEVYKGVVPVFLGSDALGGAVNVVTNQKIKQYLDASYSVGSFNTNRASLNARYTFKNGFTVNATGFYNYSDNNYKIDVAIITDTSSRMYDWYGNYTVKTFGSRHQKRSPQPVTALSNWPGVTSALPATPSSALAMASTM